MQQKSKEMKRKYFDILLSSAIQNFLLICFYDSSLFLFLALGFEKRVGLSCLLIKTSRYLESTVLLVLIQLVLTGSWVLYETNW